MIKTILNKILLVAVTLIGLWLIVFELGMLASEPHAFKGAGIFFFVVFISLGFSLSYFGIKNLLKKKVH